MDDEIRRIKVAVSADPKLTLYLGREFKKKLIFVLENSGMTYASASDWARKKIEEEYIKLKEQSSGSGQ